VSPGQILGGGIALACVASATLLGIGWLAQRAYLWVLKVSTQKPAVPLPGLNLPPEDDDV
jgi:hypothetical protein